MIPNVVPLVTVGTTPTCPRSIARPGFIVYRAVRQFQLLTFDDIWNRYVNAFIQSWLIESYIRQWPVASTSTRLVYVVKFGFILQNRKEIVINNLLWTFFIIKNRFNTGKSASKNINILIETHYIKVFDLIGNLFLRKKIVVPRIYL